MNSNRRNILLQASVAALAAVMLLAPSNGSAGGRLGSMRAVHPNPFTEGTTFQLSMPRDGDIRITVYDLLGKPMQTLYEGFQRAGKYDVPWDGKDMNGEPVPPGVYICVLFSNGIAVKPVKVIKVAA